MKQKIGKGQQISPLPVVIFVGWREPKGIHNWFSHFLSSWLRIDAYCVSSQLFLMDIKCVCLFALSCLVSAPCARAACAYGGLGSGFAQGIGSIGVAGVNNGLPTLLPFAIASSGESVSRLKDLCLYL